MADRQRRTPHTGFWTRVTAVAFAAVVAVGVLTTGGELAWAINYCVLGNFCQGPGDSTTTPPPPPPSRPEMSEESWYRVYRAVLQIDNAGRTASQLDDLSSILARQLRFDQLRNEIDIGIDYVPPGNGGGLLDSPDEFQKLDQEAEGWLRRSGPWWTLRDGVWGDLTGVLSLRLPFKEISRSGPEWGEWHAYRAEGIAEIATRNIKHFQSDIVAGLGYHDDSLDRRRTLRETVRRLVTEATEVAGLISPGESVAFNRRAEREIADTIRHIRAGAFGGQQGPVPPVARHDAIAVDPLAPSVLTAAQLLGNDSDANGDSLTIVSVGDVTSSGSLVAGLVGGSSLSSTSPGKVELVQASSEPAGGRQTASAAEGASPDGGGTPAITSRQRVIFTPNELFSEGPGYFPYTIRDSRGQEADAVVFLTASREVPVAVDDTVRIRPRSFTIIPVADLLANDEAQDGRTLTINRVSDSRGGAAVFNGSSVIWTANDGATGGSFTYHVWDALGAGISGTVTLVPDQDLARELNTAPAPGDDLVMFPTSPVALTIPLDTLIANDRDPERQPLEFHGLQSTRGTAVNGSVRYNPDRDTVSFLLDDDSTSGSFVYSVSDIFGAVGTATVTVQRYDRPPLTHPDLLTVDPEMDPTPASSGAPPGSIPYADVTIPAADLLANDRDPEELPLRLVAVEEPRNGVVRLDGDSVVFTPDGGGSSLVIITDGQAADRPDEEKYGIHGGSFAYLAEDPYGNRRREWVNLSVTSGPPVASDDYLSGFVNAPTPIRPELLLRNDNHPNDRRMTLELVRDPVNGRAVYAPDGVIRFTPGAAFATEGGGFTYQIADGVGGRATAAVHLTPGNALPEPADDRIEVSRSEPTAIDVRDLLANDVEPDGEALRVVAILDARGGDFTLEYPDSGALPVRSLDGAQTLLRPADLADIPGGTYRSLEYPTVGGNLVRFTPGPDFAETGARFDYVVLDDRYGRAAATVLLSAGNEAPVGQPDLIVRPRANRYEISAGDLTANDTDADGDPLSIRSVASGRDGVASLSSDGRTVIFEPAMASANGVFSYVVVDSMDGESFSTVTVQQAVGVPEAVNDVVDVTGEGPWRISIADLMANDRDPAGDGLTFGGIVETGAAGQASFDGVSAFVLYEPAPGEDSGAGEDSAAACRDQEPGLPWAPPVGASFVPVVGIADPVVAICPASETSTAHTFRYRINTVRGSAVGAVTLRPARDRLAPEAVDDRIVVAFSDANEAFIPVSGLLANDSLPAGDGAALSVVDVFDTDGVYGYLSDDGETVVLGAAPTFAEDADASADRVGGGFSYRIGDGRGAFATARVTLMAAPEVGTPVMVATLPPDGADEPEMRVGARFDVELIQAVLVSGEATPFLPQNPLGGTPLGSDAAVDYSGSYTMNCVVVSDAAAIEADFHIAGSHPLTVAQTAGTLSLTSDTPILGIAGPFPNPPEFALSGAVSDGFGGTLSSNVTGRFIEPDRISVLYSIGYSGSPSFTSDFQCDGRM